MAINLNNNLAVFTALRALSATPLIAAAASVEKVAADAPKVGAAQAFQTRTAPEPKSVDVKA